MRSAADRAAAWLAGARGRLLASDPGRGRLSMAFAAALAVGTTLAVEYVFAALTGAGAQGSLVSMLLGAVVAMLGANALGGAGNGIWDKIRTAVFFPVAIGIGMLAAVLVGPHTALMLGVFVLVMFLAVLVRRFGLPFFFYGFMTWMGYFFATFLHATLATLPGLVLATVVATVWILLLSATVLRTKPRSTMRSTLRAFDAQVQSLARDCAQLLEDREESVRRRSRLLHRIGGRAAGVAEVALMAEAWSEDPRAMPPGWSAPALRRRLIDTQQAVDRLVAAALALAGVECADPGLVHAGRRLLDAVARGGADDVLAGVQRLESRAETLMEDEARSAARRLAAAVTDYQALEAASDQPPQLDPVEADTPEFEAAAPLVMGNLPGSPAVARDVPARGVRWNPLARLDMTSRQAVQVALATTLAIVAGREVSSTRYYWAVIAAFVMFTGTGTRTETFLKAFNRVIGTLVGLVAAVFVAHLTAGDTLLTVAVILACVFCGFYLIKVSYAYMIFFITIMVGQMYSVLGTFSDQLLVLRLEETAVGAAAGILVALLVVPLSTRDTVRAARDELLTATADLLAAAADTLDGGRPDLDALSRTLDDRTRRMRLVAKPLTRPLVAGNDSRNTRHRVALYTALAAHGRGLTVAARRASAVAPLGPPEPGNVRTPERAEVDLAVAARSLAEAARSTTARSPGRAAHEAEEPLAQAARALEAGPPDDPRARVLVRLHDTLAELAGGTAAISR